MFACADVVKCKSIYILVKLSKIITRVAIKFFIALAPGLLDAGSDPSSIPRAASSRCMAE